MPSDFALREEAVLQVMVPNLEAEGFSGFLRPSKTMLPAFLSNFRPDAIAIKGDRKLVIEVLTQPQQEGPQLERMRQAMSEHPEWEFRVIYAPPLDSREDIPALSKEIIEDQLRRIETSFDGMGGPAALLMAWASFEAAARRLTPDNFARPQNPTRLIETLASDGSVTWDEAETLRDLRNVRNDIAHGRLDLAVSREQVESLAAVTRELLKLSE